MKFFSSQFGSRSYSTIIWSAFAALLLAMALIPGQISVSAQSSSASSVSSSASASASGNATGNATQTGNSTSAAPTASGNSTRNGTTTTSTTLSNFPTAAVPTSLSGSQTAPAPGAPGANTGPGDDFISASKRVLANSLEVKGGLVAGALFLAGGWALF
ncbi:unnamed protein product [Sympodiomycopsis kandeliae]